MLQLRRGYNPAAIPLYCPPQVKPSKPKGPHKVTCIAKVVPCYNIQRDLNLQPVGRPRMLQMEMDAEAPRLLTCIARVNRACVAQPVPSSGRTKQT